MENEIITYRKIKEHFIFSENLIHLHFFIYVHTSDVNCKPCVGT